MVPTTFWDSLTYQQAASLVNDAYTSSGLTWADFTQAINSAGYTVDQYYSAIEGSSAFNLMTNADGTLRYMTYTTTPTVQNELAVIGQQIDSNIAGNVVAESAYVEVPGNLALESGATTGSFTAGLSTAGKFVFKEVAPAVGAAMAGCYFGKEIDGALYNIGEALGLDPPWSMDPSTWGGLVSDIDENDPLYVQWGGKALSFLLSLGENNQAQAYIDEDALLNYGLWLKEQGMFVKPSYDYSVPENPGGSANPNLFYPVTVNVVPANTTTTVTLPSGASYAVTTTGSPVYYTVPYGWGPRTGTYRQQRGNPCFAISLTTFTWGGNQAVYSGGFFCRDTSASGPYSNFPPPPAPGICMKEDTGAYTVWPTLSDFINLYSYLLPAGGISGVTDQPGATIPQNPTWQTPQDVKAWLDTNLPGWDANKVTNTVPQPDGSTKTYNYIPVPYVVYNQDTETNPSTGDSTQQDPKINVPTYPYLPTITSSAVKPVDPDKPPKKGGGSTPTIIPPTGKSSALWSIYNPTQAEVDAFGAWLWSSNFVEQLKKLFNDPMQAIIGIHKVFATPSINGRGEITCGYIGSGVYANLVDNQYTKVDCGTIYLQEYFGNVFDYEPHTSISLFLPFIGIVPLNPADVVRSRLTVIYHVDVLTGACLAEVQVKRDGVGGIIYSFSGSCIVSYPISSGSYMSTITSVANMAINAVGLGIAASKGNSLSATMFAGGLANNFFSEKTSVQRSGNFGGAAGAMGGKTPYLIISRTQPELANDFEHYIGIPSNETVTLGSVSGYARIKSTHVENITSASIEEKTEIENLLKSGVLIQS